MKRFMLGADRGQSTLLPECLDDWIDESNPVRAVDAFVDALDLAELGFEGVAPEVTGRPSYHPSALLKLYIYGYLNRVQSSRRLEREAGRNVEVMWLKGRLVPDHKTIADFRKDNGEAIRKVCARFIMHTPKLCKGVMITTDARKYLPQMSLDHCEWSAVQQQGVKTFSRWRMDLPSEQSLERKFPSPSSVRLAATSTQSPRIVVREYDEAAPNLRSLWRTFRHGDAPLVGQQVLQEDVQRPVPP